MDLKCNDMLAEEGLGPYSYRQYYDDVRFLENHYNAPIVRSGGRVGYGVRGFSINEKPMDEAERKAYEDMLSMLRRFCQESRSALTADLRDAMRRWIGDEDTEGRAVSFDRVDNYEGMVWFDPLFEHIVRREAIDLCYKPFNAEQMWVTLSPYHLKQYNGRWFLIARREYRGQEVIHHFALDRIEDIRRNDRAEYRPTDIDFGEYFFPVIGVTKPVGGREEVVKLRVRRREYPYIETKPLHPTQEKEGEDADSVTISIEVMVNFELKQKLLSHADYLTVLSPQSLREEMKELIDRMRSNYAD